MLTNSREIPTFNINNSNLLKPIWIGTPARTRRVRFHLARCRHARLEPSALTRRWQLFRISCQHKSRSVSDPSEAPPPKPPKPGPLRVGLRPPVKRRPAAPAPPRPPRCQNMSVFASGHSAMEARTSMQITPLMKAVLVCANVAVDGVVEINYVWHVDYARDSLRVIFFCVLRVLFKSSGVASISRG